MKTNTEQKLYEYVPGQIWLHSYPVKIFGTKFDARMTVVRLPDGKLWLHSPCEIDDSLRQALGTLGEVAYIVAPGTLHHLHVPSAQAAFPEAKTFICPGLERKRPMLRYDALLGDEPPTEWASEFDQVLVRGNRLVSEVAFFHKPSETLILVDLVENFTDATPHTNWQLKLWWKLLRMWNSPKPAPEYQFGWTDKEAARTSLKRILNWNFKRVILAHGDLIESEAKQVVRRAWQNTPAGG